jgi:hypothetical protein
LEREAKALSKIAKRKIYLVEKEARSRVESDRHDETKEKIESG